MNNYHPHAEDSDAWIMPDMSKPDPMNVMQKAVQLKDSGLCFKFKNDSDETGFVRYKTLTIDFEPGNMPLVLISFCNPINQTKFDIARGYLDPSLDLNKTSWPQLFYVTVKEKVLLDQIYRIAFNRIDTVNHSFLKCINPNKIMVYLGRKETERWLSL